MTIQLTGKCHNGTVTAPAQAWDPTQNKMVRGVSYVPCEKCDGKGCPKPAAAGPDAVAS